MHNERAYPRLYCRRLVFMEGDIGSGTWQETSHLSWPHASLRVVPQPVLGKSCSLVVWSRASVCMRVCVCKRKVSSPLMIRSPEEAALMGGKN